MSLHNHIDYIELPANDLGAARRFYSEAFDWNFNDYGPSYAGFAYSGADREAGGIFSGADHTLAPLAILYSDHLELSEERVRSAGGKIVKPIYSFPGGRRFHFADPCGNELAVWSDK
jgi:predicted enzyme related to lactoylglutathione lyase